MLSAQTEFAELGIGSARFALSAVTRALANGTVCGDIAAWWEQQGKLYLWLADGLGHGPQAREAAQAALSSVRRQRSNVTIPAIFAQCDQDILQTRGVAMGMAIVDPIGQTAVFGGVGNIRGLFLGQVPHHLSCSYGIVGAGYRNLNLETLPFIPGDTLILTSDGILEQFTCPDQDPDSPGNTQQWAEAILQTWGITTDDASVMVCRRLADGWEHR